MTAYELLFTHTGMALEVYDVDQALLLVAQLHGVPFMGVTYDDRSSKATGLRYEIRLVTNPKDADPVAIITEKEQGVTLGEVTLYKENVDIKKFAYDNPTSVVMLGFVREDHFHDLVSPTNDLKKYMDDDGTYHVWVTDLQVDLRRVDISKGPWVAKAVHVPPGFYKVVRR